MKTKEDVLAEATSQANSPSVVGWGALGFFFGLIGILIAYLKKVSTPVELLIDLDGDNRDLFERKYNQLYKKRQIQACWAGFGIGICLMFMILCSVIGGASI